jgi:hypothetical protein
MPVSNRAQDAPAGCAHLDPSSAAGEARHDDVHLLSERSCAQRVHALRRAASAQVRPLAATIARTVTSPKTTL